MPVGLTDHLTDTEVTSMNKLLIYKVRVGRGALYGVSLVVFSCFSLLEVKTCLIQSVLGECSDIKYADG